MAHSPEARELPGALPSLAKGWEYVPLDRLVDESRGICYGIVQPGSAQEDGIPVVRVTNIRQGHIYTDDVLQVSPEIEAKYTRSRLRGGEVLLTLVGSLGESAVVPDELAGWNVARAVGVIPVLESIGARWVELCLRSATIQHYIRTWATTTVQATFNLRDLARIPIPLPEPKEREAISRILGALDDKIELNRRMNETLEAMAQALFKSWFVDFDPVRAKAAGEQPPSLAPHIADLFPDAFEESEVGDIPKGWEVGTVGKDFNITMGQSPPGETYNEEANGLPFYQGRRDFGFRYPSLRVYCTAPTRFAEPGDTLVSVRAPVGDINMAIEDCCVGRGVAAVRHKTGSRSYTYYAMKSLRTRFDRFEAEGTVFGSLNKRDFHNLPFLIPPTQFVDEFEKKVFPIDERIKVSVQESQTLSELRDTLLPKLISGELRVPEAERQMEEAQ